MASELENLEWTTAARIYNSTVAAWSVSAAWELGALDELEKDGILDIGEFAARNRLDRGSTLGMFKAMAAVGVVVRDETKVVPGAAFAEVFRTRSFFHWLTRGSAELFRQMPTVMREENRTGQFYQRDSGAIAFACREISKFCYDPWLWKSLDDLDFDVRAVADLGCGSGDRLVQILERHPSARGLGVDIAADAVVAAADAAREKGLDDRLGFVVDDILALEDQPEFGEVDLLLCFMAGHDLWPEERCVNTLARLRALFPNVRRFLVGDATRTPSIPDDELPVFTAGFELAHDLMGTYLPTVAEWESVFAAGGWHLRRKHTIDLFVGEVIFELEPQ